VSTAIALAALAFVSRTGLGAPKEPPLESIGAQKGGPASTAVADLVFDDGFGKVRSDGFISVRCGDSSSASRYCGAPEPLVKDYPNGVLGVGPECSRIYYAVRDGNYVFRPRTTLVCAPDADTGLNGDRRRAVIDFGSVLEAPANCGFTQISSGGTLNVCMDNQLIEDLQLFAPGLFTAQNGSTTAVRLEIEQLSSPSNSTLLEIRYESPLAVTVDADGTRTVSTSPTGALATLWEHRLTVNKKKTTTVVERIGSYDLPLRFTARPEN
jgi:hypothetical protein